MPAILILIGFVTYLGNGNAARAAVISAESEGYGLQVDLSVLNVLSVDLLALTPAQRATGIAPDVYTDSATAVPVDVNIGATLGSILGTAVELNLATVDGVLNSTASSNVDGIAGPRITDAFGQVNGLDLDVVDAGVTLVGIPTLSLDLVDITAGTISSTAAVSGDGGALTAVGSSIIQDLTIEVSGLELDLASLLGAHGSIDANGFLTAAPNTHLLNLGGIIGLNLTLNEQIVTGDGAASRGIEVNAVRLTFNGVALGLPLISETLNGDIQIGHSRASVIAVPEPASLALLTGGLCLIARRRTTNG